MRHSLTSHLTSHLRAALALITWTVLSAPSLLAQVPTVGGASGSFTRSTGNPWENALDEMFDFMTGPVALGISSVAIVLGGLSYAMGEGQNKKAIAALVFGCGMALGAVNLLNWLL